MVAGMAAIGLLVPITASDHCTRRTRPAYLACLGSVNPNLLPHPGLSQGSSRAGATGAVTRRFQKSLSTGSLNMHDPLVSSFLRRRSGSSFFRLNIGNHGAGLNLASMGGEGGSSERQGQTDHTEGRTEFIAECKLPTDKGQFRLRSYRYKGGKIVVRNGERVLEWTEMEPVVVIHGDISGKEGVMIRVHDQCFTSEVLGSKRCDCKEQLDMAMAHIMESEGALIYMPQEGRGIGLANKIAAYELQDTGMDTVDANRHLGFDDDERSYSCVPFILEDLGIKSLKLVTNNPYKINQLREMGVNIDSVQGSFVVPNSFNEKYLRTKVERMAHLLSLDKLRVPVIEEESEEKADNALNIKTIEESAEELRQGKMIMVVTGEGANARGGLVVLAHAATTEAVTAMSKVSGAYLEVLLPQDRWDQLGLGGAMGPVSLDMAGLGAMAIAARGRASTLCAVADRGVEAQFFDKPGHLFCRKLGADGGAFQVATEALAAEAGGGEGPAIVGMCEVVSDGGVLAPGMAELAQIADTMKITVVHV